MARQPSPIQVLEFQRLLAFVEVGFADSLRMLPIPADKTPTALVTELWARSPAQALRGLREAARDVVEMTQDLDGAALTAFERRLADAKAPSLRTMRRRRASSIYAILARGRIRSDEEYRLLSGEASDMASGLFDDDARRSAESLLARHEIDRAG